MKDLCIRNIAIVLTKSYIEVTQSNKTMWVSDMFYSTSCSCKFIFVRIDIHRGATTLEYPAINIASENAHYAGSLIVTSARKC